MRCGRLSLISAMTLSALRKRYFLPNIAVTEQKVQSNGQPQLVMIGIVVSLSLPTSRRRSGNGSVVEVGAGPRAAGCAPRGRRA